MELQFVAVYRSSARCVKIAFSARTWSDAVRKALFFWIDFPDLDLTSLELS